MGKGGMHRIASDNPVFNNNYSQSKPSTPCRLPNHLLHNRNGDALSTKETKYDGQEAMSSNKYLKRLIVISSNSMQQLQQAEFKFILFL